MNETRLLYERPGPVGVLRNRLYAVAGAALVLALTFSVLHRLYQKGQFDQDRWAVFFNAKVWGFLLTGLEATLLVAAISGILSFGFAVPVALMRLSERASARKCAEVYISAFRAVPLLLLILFMAVLLPTIGLAWPAIAFLVVALTLHHSALMAEIVRAGILSLPRGQAEAARAIGMRPATLMQYIILPQAIRRMMPALIGQLLAIVQDTSLGYIIPYNELLRCSQLISTYAPQSLLQAAFVSTLMYGIVSVLLMLIQWRIKSRIRGVAR
ncbi:amino acid ABC transporter permease [Paraburkholderia sp. JHI2823]|uniref:amino acid ABC transporter permease n=1 Tax=Paraburkholderia TaxID=1822464 RepID=UPI00316F8682